MDKFLHLLKMMIIAPLGLMLFGGIITALGNALSLGMKHFLNPTVILASGSPLIKDDAKTMIADLFISGFFLPGFLVYNIITGLLKYITTIHIVVFFIVLVAIIIIFIVNYTRHEESQLFPVFIINTISQFILKICKIIIIISILTMLACNTIAFIVCPAIELASGSITEFTSIDNNDNYYIKAPKNSFRSFIINENALPPNSVVFDCPDYKGTPYKYIALTKKHTGIDAIVFIITEFVRGLYLSIKELLIKLLYPFIITCILCIIIQKFNQIK